MISIEISTLILVLLAMCNGDGNMGRRHEEKRKAFRECKNEHGYTDEMATKLQKEYPDNRFKPEDVPKQFLCTMKCVDEKIGKLKNGKYEIDDIGKNKFFMSSLKTPEEYLKCLEKIDEVKECEDYKKKMKCDYENGDTHMRECSTKFKVNVQNMAEASGEKGSRNKNHKCFHKCVLESKGIISKDGKIAVDVAEKDVGLMWRVKEADQFLNCLKNVEIKDCEDISKIWSCRKNE
ncbi:uncharacterized protein LOC123319775 [Coccinella septempunctata]|uniref:uncharacterized protein LOC123319775 n=1 Tax=Coccinella septempunctata TaxID=41139 RepID=UPI001D06555E|nr:uncharacterized protein LOC123319775 [Coccinella septempunctata]